MELKVWWRGCVLSAELSRSIWRDRYRERGGGEGEREREVWIRWDEGKVLLV
jgi:hypothetical protein